MKNVRGSHRLARSLPAFRGNGNEKRRARTKITRVVRSMHAHVRGRNERSIDAIVFGRRSRAPQPAAAAIEPQGSSARWFGTVLLRPTIIAIPNAWITEGSGRILPRACSPPLAGAAARMFNSAVESRGPHKQNGSEGAPRSGTLPHVPATALHVKSGAILTPGHRPDNRGHSRVSTESRIPLSHIYCPRQAHSACRTG